MYKTNKEHQTNPTHRRKTVRKYTGMFFCLVVIWEVECRWFLSFFSLLFSQFSYINLDHFHNEKGEHTHTRRNLTWQHSFHNANFWTHVDGQGLGWLHCTCRSGGSPSSPLLCRKIFSVKFRLYVKLPGSALLRAKDAAATSGYVFSLGYNQFLPYVVAFWKLLEAMSLPRVF